MRPDVSSPRLHFVPSSGWMNDPNGLVFFEDEWHLFYQVLPEGASQKHWGHAVSRDLLRWEHLPIALFPDADGQIFSGSCVVDARNSSGFFGGGSGLVAIFTRHRDGEPASESQGLAYSSDRGRTWKMYEGNPVLNGTQPDFRDPKVFWHAPSGAWVMILAAGDRAEIYRSPDLKSWSFASAFGKGRMPDELCWECPDLFSLRDEKGQEVWILTTSFLDRANFQGKVASCITCYFPGDFDGYTFRSGSTEPPRRLTWGPDDYAAVTYDNAPRGRRILTGWLNHWGYCWHTGQMTLPRELHWRNGAIMQALPAEVDKSAAWHRMQIDGAGKAPFVLPAPGLIVIAPVIPSWRLEAHRGDSPIFSLERDAARGLWIFQRGAGSFPAGWARLKEGLEAAFTAPLSAPLGARAGETTIAIDSCSVETFCDGGGVFFAAQVFPADEEWSFKFQPISGTAKFAT